MDIKQLQYFLAVAQERTITEAARRLNMAQPPLSHQMKQLEQELGVALMNRDRKGVRLTEAGRLLSYRGEQILELLALTQKELIALQDGATGTLTIGTVASAGAAFLPARIHLFHERYPAVDFQVWEGDTAGVMDLLARGVVELGIARMTKQVDDYEMIPFATEPMVAAFPRDWPEAAEEGDAVPIRLLARVPLLVHRSNAPMILASCRDHGVEPRIMCKGDDVRTLLAWADSRLGVAVVARSAMELAPSDQLTYKRIIGVDLKVQKALFWMKNRALSAAARHFVELIMEPAEKAKG